jgi:mycoredoxin
MAKKIVIYTTTWCPDCRAAKKFLASKNLSYEEIDIEENPDAAEIVMKLSDGMRRVPTLDIEGTIVSGDKFHPSRFEKDLRDAGAL